MKDTVVIILIFLGTGIMFLSILKTRGILKLLRGNRHIHYWRFLFWLMLFFLGGYVMAIAFVVAGVTEILLILIGVVFFFGAVFVYLVVRSGYLTIDDILRTTAERQRAENELRKHRDHLEEVVAERTAALLTTNEQLQQEVTERKQAEEKAESANRAKTEFLASISHELRTPLNAILGFAQLMHRRQDLSPKNQEHLEVITRSGKHLLTLVNRLIEIARSEAERPILDEQRFDLARLLDEVKAIEDRQADLQGLNSRSNRHGNGSSQQTNQNILTPSALAALPDKIRVDLQQAVEMIDIEMTNSIIEQIRQHNEPLADVLAELMKNFRFDVLQKLFEEIL
jgi:signal transduction histidine kinase